MNNCGSLSLRRHKLRISRACAFKELFAQALNHSAAPPLPKKSVGLFGGPVIMFRHTRPSGTLSDLGEGQ